MEQQTQQPKAQDQQVLNALPQYEKPTIKVMNEKDILSMFQVTQSMGAWWTVPSC